MTGAWLLGAWLAATPAPAADAVQWSLPPDLIPWETITEVIDGERYVARSRKELRARRKAVMARVEASVDPAAAASAMIELGDLYRDEARLVLLEDYDDPDRMLRLRTSPAWLQLELALQWYAKARAHAPATAVPHDERLRLLEAVTLTRLGEDSATLDTDKGLLKEYRRSPYADVARLAVADHLVRTGEVDRGKVAYGTVRGSSHTDLDAYARFRLAHAAAVEGERTRAEEALAALVGDAPSSPLQSMIRQGAMAALATHQADKLPLPEMLGWIDTSCADEHLTCREDLRHAAADRYADNGVREAAAWLIDVDGLGRLARHADLRVAAGEAVARGDDGWVVFTALEPACAGLDEACRADLAVALANFFEDLGRPEAAWMKDYLRLPKVAGRPDIGLALARLAQTPTIAVEEALDRIEGMCGADVACRSRAREAVVGFLLYGWRRGDAAWVRSLDDLPDLPEVDGLEAAFPEVARGRMGARQALQTLEGYCPDEACRAELREALEVYYGVVGMHRERAWLRAIASPPYLAALPDLQPVFEQALRDDLVAAEAFARVTGACARRDAVCVDVVRDALQRHYDALGDYRSLAWLDALPRLGGDDPVGEALIEVMVRELGPLDALDALAGPCAFEPRCTAKFRQGLYQWYRWNGDFEAAQWVDHLADAPIVPKRRRMNAILGQILEHELGPSAALQAILRGCSDEPACTWETATVLSSWMERHGDDTGASWLRSQVGAATP